MALIKSLPPRSTRQSDADIVSKTKNAKPAVTTVKGGKGIYDSISTITAVVESKLGKYRDKYLLLREEQEVREYFGKIIFNGYGALDTETDSLDPIMCNLAGMCLYTPGEKACYIPVHHISYVTMVEVNNQVPESVIIEGLELCNQIGVKWVMHNAKYDIRVVKNKLGVGLTCYWDTMLAARCLNENESAALKNLHIKYCPSEDNEAMSYDKLFEGIPFTHIPIKVGYLYAAGDPIKTWQLYEFQKKYLNRATLPGPYKVFSEIEMPCIAAIAAMEDTGVAFDIEFAAQLSTKYTALLQEQEKRFYDVLSMYSNAIDAYKRSVPNHKLGDPVNISSSVQIAIILYDVLKLQSIDKENPRGTGEDILVALNVPLSSAILEYRETAKLLSTYVDKLPKVVSPKDNRIHASFNQGGTITGRISSSDPNMQNIPSHNKEIRKMFIATEGYVLISCDFSQQEPRTLAHMSGDSNLIQAYADGKDIYAWIASSIYKVPYDECKEFRPDNTKNPEGKKRRDSVKSIILGIMYSRGAKAIGEQLGVSAKEAQKIVDKFFQTYPKVKQFIDSVQKQATELGYVETAWGRKRRLPDMQLPEYEFKYAAGTTSPNFDPLSFDTEQEVTDEVPWDIQSAYIARLKKTWSVRDRAMIKQEAKQLGIIINDNGGKIAEAGRQCVNSIIQGSAADMTKKAMIAIHNDSILSSLGCRMLLQVHDELIVECPIKNAKAVAARVSELMIAAASEKISVPMKCDAEITREWYGESIKL